MNLKWLSMWTLKLSSQAVTFYEGVTGKYKTQLTNGLNKLSQDPHIGKMLKGDLRDYWSYRVGVYRIIYKIHQEEIIVEVLRIQHRKEVYEKFRR
ncbi:MAG: type II toxin-antitoxin system RelE/ParE family toxin [Deltaproteobacteria bacterium]|nr:type II toxin-antitoxin system RelE/ParE family toxin [Deltaproteobacteria bacterium]